MSKWSLNVKEIQCKKGVGQYEVMGVLLEDN